MRAAEFALPARLTTSEGAGVIHRRATIIRMSMIDEIPDGPGIATLVVPMPGSVRPPTDTAAAMLSWLSAHGAPRTAEVLGRLQRQAWTIELPNPDAATQTELWATARFSDVEQARAAARPHHGRVRDLMRWASADQPADATLLRIAEEPPR